MESMNDRQMALMELMYSTLRSVDRRIEETKYVDDLQVALLRSIDRRIEERNEGLKCFGGNDGKRSCYKFVQVKMTRDGARTHCRNIGDGVDLVSTESQQHTNFLLSDSTMDSTMDVSHAGSTIVSLPAHLCHHIPIFFLGNYKAANCTRKTGSRVPRMTIAVLVVVEDSVDTHVTVVLWLTHLFEEMSRNISTRVICFCLALCVWLSPLTAQPTTEQCSEDSDRQVVLMEQIILIMESTNDRQMALMEQMHSILTSVDRRMEEIKHVDDRQVASMVQMHSTMQSVEGRMEETKYVNDRQVALLQSIDRRMEESNEDPPVGRRFEQIDNCGDVSHRAKLAKGGARKSLSRAGLHCLRKNDGKRACYKFVQVKMTRDEARTYCRNRGEGVDLVSVESQQETNFLASVIKGLPAKCRIYHTSGEKKSGVWQWTATGQPFNYTGWAPGEPSGTGNFCFIWNKFPGWKTWDDQADSQNCFICEY
ncbi:Lithostathine-1 [Lamellibrachia satsuma]|nr:Lithostathine-1 [Lamellibrachia satsuma]